MRTKADAVIIGGGIIGMAVAYYLAKANYGKIILLEKEVLLGAGATSKAAGGIRAQFSTKVNIEMSMLSEKIFARFKEETGNTAIFDQVGYMFLLQSDSELESFKHSYQLQKSLGLAVQWLEKDQISQFAPHISLEGVKAATLCLQDGLGDPHEFLSGYEKAARRLGVEIELETSVMSIEHVEGEVRSVATNKGTIKTDLVINCTGPQASLIGKMVGLDIPIEPVRRQIVTTGELSFITQNIPMVVDVKSGLYFHKESKGLLLGWADRSVEPSFDISIDPEYTDTILEKALERIPQLEEAEIANEWAGLYETTPDHHAIISRHNQVQGFITCAGFSGHGFMHAPAAGILVAELVTRNEPSIDISTLSAERFEAGVGVKETNVI